MGLNSERYLGSDLTDVTNGLGNDDKYTIRDTRKYVSVPSTTQVSERDYMCPKCEGEFNTWDTKYRLGDTDELVKSGDIVGTVHKPSIDEVSVCPFCELERGEYNEK